MVFELLLHQCFMNWNFTGYGLSPLPLRFVGMTNPAGSMDPPLYCSILWPSDLEFCSQAPQSRYTIHNSLRPTNITLFHTWCTLPNQLPSPKDAFTVFHCAVPRPQCVSRQRDFPAHNGDADGDAARTVRGSGMSLPIRLSPLPLYKISIESWTVGGFVYCHYPLPTLHTEIHLSFQMHSHSFAAVDH